LENAHVLSNASSGDALTIRGRSVHRLGRVLRLRRGDRFEIVHEAGDALIEAELTRIGPDSVEAQIANWRPIQEPVSPFVWICPSVVRAPRFDLLVEKTTELGVHGIRPVRATRSLAQAHGRERTSRWRRLVTEASEQCRRERRPIVDSPIDLLDLVSGPVPTDCPSGGYRRLFASAREPNRRISDAFADRPRPVIVELLVGPEGGFTETEATAALDNGWLPISLGPRPLRAETAAIVGAALVQEALRACAP
jgi:16S rRNA (uracil1498-N3)-methyltransferase